MLLPIQITVVETENILQMAAMEPINKPPPAYAGYEFLFVDDSGEEENAPPPTYFVPFIDPPEYGEGENPTPELPPDEKFVSPTSFPGMKLYGMNTDST